MPGTIPLSMTQQFDEFGKPLKGGALYIYQANSVATPQNSFQDFGLSILHPWPLPLDAAGRIPQFFLADGFVKIRLVNNVGVTQLAQDNVLVVGPSLGGGGGGAGVDATRIIQTGMLAWFYGTTAVVPGYVRCNGRSIGNASSGATERQFSDTFDLFSFLYTQDANLVLRDSGGGVVGRTNIANDYNILNRNIALPDWRGRLLAGLDGMGSGSLAGRLTLPYAGMGVVGWSADQLGAVGGLENIILSLAHIPSGITSDNPAAFPLSVDHAVPSGKQLARGGSAVSNWTPNIGNGGTINTPRDSGGGFDGVSGINSTGSIAIGAADVVSNHSPNSQAHRVAQPFMLTTFYIKL